MHIQSSNWSLLIQEIAAQLGISVTQEMCEKFQTHAEELLFWNEKKNLTAITEADDIAVKHFADSSVLAPHIAENERVLDMGAGGGFPGLVLAIQRPDIDILLIDASRKKASFLQHIIRKLSLSNANASHIRAEELAEEEDLSPFDVVTCRAFSNIKEVVKLALPLLSKQGRILAMRGKIEDEELEKAMNAYPTILVKEMVYRLPVENADRTLLEIIVI